MADFDWSGLLSGLGNLYGAYRGSQTANDINSTVGNLLGAQQGAYNQQLQNLQQQIALGQSVTQGQYNQAQEAVNAQNAGLQSNIDYLTNVLTGLSDPNSIYMQGQKNILERQDAAAGRRANVSDRQVALDSKLAQYIAQYSPALQQAINQASGLMTQNQTGLANIYDTMSRSADRNNIALGNLLTGMGGAANTANSTQRGAANSATNNLTGMIGAGSSLLGSLFGNNGLGTQAAGWLGGLFGGDSGGWGTSATFDWGNYGDTSGILDSIGTGYDYGDYSGYGGGDPYSSYGF